jgi:hypothetical protein
MNIGVSIGFINQYLTLFLDNITDVGEVVQTLGDIGAVLCLTVKLSPAMFCS